MPQDQERLLWLMARAIEKLLAADARKKDLSPVQFFALRFISLHEKPTLSEVAGGLSISNAAVTRLIDRLELKGLIARDQGAIDRRERNLRLTKRGEEIMTEVVSAGDRRFGEILQRLDQGERDKLCAGIEAFLSSALPDAASVQEVCLRCGEQHDKDCYGEILYRGYHGPPRQV